MRSIKLLAAAVLAFGLTASAATINGSFVLSTAGATKNGTNLLDSTVFVPTSPITLTPPSVGVGLKFGDYTAIGSPEEGVGGTIDLNDLASFSINFNTPTNVGTFDADGGFVVSQSVNFIDVFLLGNFTPAAGGPLAGFDPSPTSVRISLNLTGEAVGYTGTLASPPETLTPEPATFAIFGAGLAAVGLLRRRAKA